MKQNKVYIVITGQIASGKSTFSNLLNQRNSEDFLIIDSDDQIKELYKRGAVLYNILVNEFGSLILNEKRNISKKKLRDYVLLDDENRERLNALTHPIILKNMINIAKSSDKEIIFLEIPLLNESIKYLEKLITIAEVWNITADKKIRYKRLLQRKNMTEEIAKKLIAMQSEFENDDYDVLTVENNGTLGELDNKIDLFVENGVLNDMVDDSFFERKDGSCEEIEQETEQAQKMPLQEENEKEDSNLEPIREKEDDPIDSNEKETYKTYFKNDDIDQTKVIDLKNINFSSEKNFSKDNISEDLRKVFNEKDEQQKPNNYSTLFNDKEDSKNLDQDSKINFPLTEVEDILDEKDEEDKDSYEVEKERKKKKNTKGRKKKEKMRVLKKIKITIAIIVAVLLALFLGSIAYGGKNYSLHYLDEIQKYSNEYNVDPKVVLAIMKVESDFNPSAQSHANAKGLMQVMPETAKHVAQILKTDPNSIDLNNPDTNIEIGTCYLKFLMTNFRDLNTVYAAYNGGFGNVTNWLKDEKYSQDGVTLSNIPVEETKHYVKKVNKALKAYEVLYGEKFPTKAKKGFSKFIDNLKNTLAYLVRTF